VNFVYFIITIIWICDLLYIYLLLLNFEDMKVNIKKFQEGGAMAPQAAPAQDPAATQQDPIMQIA
jgi:hypothetical protein